MEFLKVIRRFRKPRRKSMAEEPDPGNTPPIANVEVVDAAVEDEDDEDFIADEIKRRLKELRRSNFMVLIPEESCPEEDESSSSGWRESDEADDAYPSWSGFDDLHARYCERMFFFDKVIAQKIFQEELEGAPAAAASCRRSGRRRGLFCFKRVAMPEGEDGPRLLQSFWEVEGEEPQSFETAYVSQLCLTWEALHWQYGQLKRRLSSSSSSSPRATDAEAAAGGAISYGLAAQRLQEFRVLLQRFLENEPFQRAPRAEYYWQSRLALPNLLQLPPLQGLGAGPGEHDEEDDESLALSPRVAADDVMAAMEAAILAFRRFLKAEKRRSPPGRLIRFGGQQRDYADSLLQVQKSLDKKETKLKELFRRKKTKRAKTRAKTKTKTEEGSWPGTEEEVELLFGLTDMKVLFRVLGMGKLRKEYLLWCEEKMSKLQLSHLSFHRDPSPVLFPCC
ncbi:DUF1666 family protein (DUF1666) [Wolffia australiana]